MFMHALLVYGCKIHDFMRIMRTFSLLLARECLLFDFAANENSEY